MTPRERIFAALNHRPCDRTPADYSGHQPVANALIARLGLRNYEELLQVLGVDLRRIWVNYNLPNTGPDAQGYVHTMWGVRVRRCDPGDGQPNWISPFSEATTVADVHAHPWPNPQAVDCSTVRAQCDRWHGEYATFGAPWSPFFHEVGWLIGQERFYEWMTTKPEVTQAIIDHVVDYEVQVSHRFFAACAGRLDLAYYGNDFGTQRGLFIGPQKFERFLRRPLKRFFDTAHAYGCKVMQHSCGSVRALIPWFLEDGVDVLDPIQVRAAGMDLASLQRDFGTRLSFHGGVDTQHTLPFGTVADVRAEVRGYLALARQHHNYILAGSQEYIADIPLDNILAIYDENQRGAAA